MTRPTQIVAATLALAAAAQVTKAADPGWPRAYTTPTGGRVQIYQPQISRCSGIAR